jgi:hypothetical protein
MAALVLPDILNFGAGTLFAASNTTANMNPTQPVRDALQAQLITA